MRENTRDNPGNAHSMTIYGQIQTFFPVLIFLKFQPLRLHTKLGHNKYGQNTVSEKRDQRTKFKQQLNVH